MMAIQWNSHPHLVLLLLFLLFFLFFLLSLSCLQLIDSFLKLLQPYFPRCEICEMLLWCLQKLGIHKMVPFISVGHWSPHFWIRHSWGIHPINFHGGRVSQQQAFWGFSGGSRVHCHEKWWKTQKNMEVVVPFVSKHRPSPYYRERLQRCVWKQTMSNPLYGLNMLDHHETTVKSQLFPLGDQAKSSKSWYLTVKTWCQFVPIT